MFADKTLFVVGSGASKEANLPVGSELADKISKLLYFEFDDYGSGMKGNYNFFSCLQRHYKHSVLNEHLRAARQISDGIFLASSIDNFIDMHQHNHFIASCGKAAIVYSILEAERASRLYVDRSKSNSRLSMRALEDTWYIAFAKILFEQVPLDRLDSVFSNISIVCFNYDRCIPQFLQYALTSVYGIELPRAQALVESLKVFHPYGSVGQLSNPKGGICVDFGKDPNSTDFVELCQSIKTYTEQIEDHSMVHELRDEVADANTLVFLGFAFHAQNMRLLTPNKKTKITRIFATVKGFSKPDSEIIQKQIFDMVSKKRTETDKVTITVSNSTCSEILYEYKRSLAK